MSSISNTNLSLKDRVANIFYTLFYPFILLTKAVYNVFTLPFVLVYYIFSSIKNYFFPAKNQTLFDKIKALEQKSNPKSTSQKSSFFPTDATTSHSLNENIKLPCTSVINSNASTVPPYKTANLYNSPRPTIKLPTAKKTDMQLILRTRARNTTWSKDALTGPRFNEQYWSSPEEASKTNKQNVWKPTYDICAYVIKCIQPKLAYDQESQTMTLTFSNDVTGDYTTEFCLGDDGKLCMKPTTLSNPDGKEKFAAAEFMFAILFSCFLSKKLDSISSFQKGELNLTGALETYHEQEINNSRSLESGPTKILWGLVTIPDKDNPCTIHFYNDLSLTWSVSTLFSYTNPENKYPIQKKALQLISSLIDSERQNHLSSFWKSQITNLRLESEASRSSFTPTYLFQQLDKEGNSVKTDLVVLYKKTFAQSRLSILPRSLPSFDELRNCTKSLTANKFFSDQLDTYHQSCDGSQSPTLHNIFTLLDTIFRGSLNCKIDPSVLDYLDDKDNFTCAVQDHSPQKANPPRFKSNLTTIQSDDGTSSTHTSPQRPIK